MNERSCRPRGTSKANHRVLLNMSKALLPRARLSFPQGSYIDVLLHFPHFRSTDYDYFIADVPDGMPRASAVSGIFRNRTRAFFLYICTRFDSMFRGCSFDTKSESYYKCAVRFIAGEVYKAILRNAGFL